MTVNFEAETGRKLVTFAHFTAFVLYIAILNSANIINLGIILIFTKVACINTCMHTCTHIHTHHTQHTICSSDQNYLAVSCQINCAITSLPYALKALQDETFKVSQYL